MSLPLAQASALLSHLGRGARDAVAEDLLRLVGAHVPLAQCTVFAFEAGRKPEVVAVGDRSRTQELPHIAHADYRRTCCDLPQVAGQRELVAALLESTG